MTATPPPEPVPAKGPQHRRGGRMKRSRAIAAGTSVGALVVLTAGVAVANPGSHSSPARAANAGAGSQAPAAGRDDGSAGDDSGWRGGDDANARSSDDSTDPNSGSSPVPPGPGTFDPGRGSGGSTRSGGS